MSTEIRRGGPSQQPHRRARRLGPALIGVGVDGGAGGRDAIALGATLAEATDAELMLIGVHEEPLAELPTGPETNWSSRQKQVWTMLMETREELAPKARIVVQPDVLVWRALRHVVRLEHRDLLVLGSRHDAEEGHVRLGKTADDLLGCLECALAIAPRGIHDRGRSPLRRVGVGFDGGPGAEAALEFAAGIALAGDAELEVVAVVDDEVGGGVRAEQIVLGGDAIIAGQEASLYERAVVAAQATGAQGRVKAAAGQPAELLIDLCHHVDLTIIGSGHSAPAGRIGLGRTGKAILREAPCPVIVVPRPNSA